MHKIKLCKGPSSHDCHLLSEQNLQVLDAQIDHRIYLGQCNPIKDDKALESVGPQ